MSAQVMSDPSRRPDLRVEVQISDTVGVLDPQLIQYLSSGLHQGVHLRLDGDNRLQGPGGFLSGQAHQVTIHLESGSGDNPTTAKVALWCPGPRRRCLLWGALAGALLATAGALAFGWLISVSVPAAIFFGVAVDQGCWRAWRRRTSHHVTALIQNGAASSGGWSS